MTEQDLITILKLFWSVAEAFFKLLIELLKL